MTNSLPTPRFNPEFNWGHVFTILAVLGSMGGGAAIWAATQARTDIELALNREARATYIPIIHELVRDNKIQDDRIKLMAEALADIRSNVETIKDDLIGARIDVAEIKAHLGDRRATQRAP
jgi:hypothetical protein